jgi:arabinogalactan endo-1,4-beta-galactosidase
MAALEKRVEQYSSDVVTQLKQAGAMPDMAQAGSLSRTDALKHCDIS